jgi:hypothetical protein
MAPRGSKKARSVEHEDFIADLYGGERSRSSGGADHQKGDVRLTDEDTLFECKTTGEPGKPAKSTLVKEMGKIADEAWATGRDPALALRFYMPDCELADNGGWVDLVVRLAGDDAYRSQKTVHQTPTSRHRQECQ